MTPQEYCAANPHLSHASRQKLRYSESRWLRLTGVPLDQVRPEHFTELRKAGLAAGLSPHSIEQTCQDVSLLTGVNRGKPLDRPLPSPRSYCLVYPASRRKSAKVQAFQQWLRAEVDAMDWSLLGRKAARLD